MLPQQAVDYYGTRSALARVCRVTDTAVGQWLKQGWMPFDKQETVEHDSKKKLEANWLDLPRNRRPVHLRAA